MREQVPRPNEILRIYIRGRLYTYNVKDNYNANGGMELQLESVL